MQLHLRKGCQLDLDPEYDVGSQHKQHMQDYITNGSIITLKLCVNCKPIIKEPYVDLAWEKRLFDTSLNYSAASKNMQLKRDYEFKL